VAIAAGRLRNWAGHDRLGTELGVALLDAAAGRVAPSRASSAARCCGNADAAAMIPSIILGFRIETVDDVTVSRRPRLSEFQ